MTIESRLARLERRSPPSPYDPGKHTCTFRPDEETLKNAFKGAIVNGLMTMRTDEEIEKLVQRTLRRYR